MGDGWAVYAGIVGASTAHAHHAFQLVQGVGGPVALRGAEDDDELPCDVAVIAPSVPHGVGPEASRAVMLYVDPDTTVGRRLRAVVPSRARVGEWRSAGEPLRSCPVERLPVEWAEAHRHVRAFTAALGADAVTGVAVHPALVRARAWLAAHLLDDRISLERVADAVGLSADRLSHLFNERLGLGLLPLVLWLRLHAAAREIARHEGATMTGAAAAAGFADAAHMSRTFRRMFGVAPTDVVGDVRWVLPPAPAPTPDAGSAKST